MNSKGTKSKSPQIEPIRVLTPREGTSPGLRVVGRVYGDGTRWVGEVLTEIVTRGNTPLTRLTVTPSLLVSPTVSTYQSEVVEGKPSHVGRRVLVGSSSPSRGASFGFLAPPVGLPVAGSRPWTPLGKVVADHVESRPVVGSLLQESPTSYRAATDPLLGPGNRWRVRRRSTSITLLGRPVQEQETHGEPLDRTEPSLTSLV